MNEDPGNPRTEEQRDRMAAELDRRRREEQQEPPADDGRAAREPAEQPAEPDVPDARAKNTGHGKKTADKWNQ